MNIQVINTTIVLVSLAGLAWLLYRPRIQQSERYQATVVPLANIMDVGFLMLTPIIVVLVGFDAPLFMLLICLVAIAAGFAIAYNIRHYEPLAGTKDRVHGVAGLSQWALFAASFINIAYYSQLMMILVLEPLGLNTDNRTTWTAVVVLAALAFIGFRYGLGFLNRLGDRTTAFNLSAIIAILVAFLAFNVEAIIEGSWTFPDYNPPNDPDRLRKLLGFFAMVQGFEASRYIGTRFSGELRISTMRLAQYVSTIVFVVLIASSLFLFSEAQPEPDATAIFVIAEQVSDVLPFIILVAAIGSQLSAIVNATSSRSDLLLEATHHSVDRRFTFLLLLVPAITVVVFADVTEAVALASRVFAFYFLLQALLAAILAARKRSWLWVAFFVGVCLAMATIAILGLSV